MIETIFFLLIIFQVKHYLADYPLQNKYMLGKFKPGWGFIKPLAAHCFVHAAMTFSIVIIMAPSLWWLAIVDFVIHFTMDRIKASPNLLGRWKPTERPFWLSLGLDQGIHHLTHYYLIWEIINKCL